jgi:hypothetical protein
MAIHRDFQTCLESEKLAIGEMSWDVQMLTLPCMSRAQGETVSILDGRSAIALSIIA